jgi:hypothetical protein
VKTSENSGVKECNHCFLNQEVKIIPSGRFDAGADDYIQTYKA